MVREELSSNSKKCKELVIRKKSCTNVFTPVFGIPQNCQLSVLGLLLQDNFPFECHVHVKLIKANKCLFILRSLRKEGYFQGELDHLFSSIVLPSITYGLRVYGASEAELTAMQSFLDRRYKRKYTPEFFSIKHLLEKHDIYVIHRPGGPYWEKLCPRSRVRPEVAGRGPYSRQRAQFFPIRTDQGR